jgi:cell division protein FtsB
VIGVDYARMSAVAVQAIKQQNARIEALAMENADLKARLQRLEARLKP